MSRIGEPLREIDVDPIEVPSKNPKPDKAPQEPVKTPEKVPARA